MTNKEIVNKTEAFVAGTYGRYPVAMVKGKGAKLWDADGKEYLDFVSGLAVCNLGHCHEKVTQAIKEQAEKLVHVSNLYHIPEQSKLAELLVQNSFADKVFFCNSGAEANEAAIKLARRYSYDNLGAGRNEIITTTQSFHGRTMATITATGQEKFSKGFEPLLPGFKHVPFNDLKALEAAIDDKICAVMVEPVQGEGGVNVPSQDYFKGVRELCNKKNVLLILDEVQVGMGRTGKLFAYENYGMEPDIMSLAKGIAGGMAMGAMLAKENMAKSFVPGTHASTFGGNPLASAAAIAALETTLEEGILENCTNMGEVLEGELLKLKDKYPYIKEVRGKGLIYGMELHREGAEIVNKALSEGLLINCAAGTVLRFLPPLIIKEEEIKQMISILDNVLEEVNP
ncbi:MAG: acetylornithine transaminase [Deltaproteobacteria bacterium]|nr:acetylornithine transaminase [Deltaproteobacteria bacterium]